MPLPSRTGQSHPTRVAAGIRSAQWRECPEILPCHLPPAPSSSFAALPRARACLALHRLASHLPPAIFHMYMYEQGRLSGCLDPAPSVCAICLPSLSVGIIVLRKAVPRYSLPINLSINYLGRQPVHQLTGRPKVAKVGNGTTRFGPLFGRGTVSPRLPAVCTPSCSSPQQEMTEGCPFTPRTMTQLNSSA